MAKIWQNFGRSFIGFQQTEIDLDNVHYRYGLSERGAKKSFASSRHATTDQSYPINMHCWVLVKSNLYAVKDDLDPHPGNIFP